MSEDALCDVHLVHEDAVHAALLDRAADLVSDDAKRAANIRQEHLPLDKSMLYLWNRLTRDAGDAWPFQRETVFQRLRDNYNFAYEKYGGWGSRRKQEDDIGLDYLRNMPPVPEQFSDKEIVDLCGPTLRLTRGGRFPRQPVDDPDAATGKTWRIDESTPNRGSDHTHPPSFGLSDCVSQPKFRVSKELAQEEIPTDEGYHWHLAGRMQATPTMYFYAHHSWIFDHPLRMAYNAALPDQNVYDVYFSMKLEGPAYVPGSERKNAFSIDRIILVEVKDEG